MLVTSGHAGRVYGHTRIPRQLLVVLSLMPQALELTAVLVLQSPSYPRHACLIASSPHSHTSTGAHLNTFSPSIAIDCSSQAISSFYLKSISSARLRTIHPSSINISYYKLPRTGYLPLRLTPVTSPYAYRGRNSRTAENHNHNNHNLQRPSRPLSFHLIPIIHSSKPIPLPTTRTPITTQLPHHPPLPNKSPLLSLSIATTIVATKQWPSSSAAQQPLS